MHGTRWSAQLLPFFLVCFFPSLPTAAQTAPERPAYARLNSFAATAGYSNNSSRMLLGSAQNRRLLNIGVAYSRRLFTNNVVNWQYDAEFFPVALENDPVMHSVNQSITPMSTTGTTETRISSVCVADVSHYDFQIQGVHYTGTITDTCRREWTTGTAFSPIGMRWNFRPREKLQPFLGGHGGEMYTAQPIPVDRAGSFNFTFDFDAGVELYRTRTRSVRVEYRYHHISNHNTAAENPGIDNGVVQVSYVFGH